ncbi:ABCA3 [Scenedesmus sp. PABB004]|nr:ABCA3 [Scenedesmus sp. PABB004]
MTGAPGGEPTGGARGAGAGKQPRLAGGAGKDIERASLPGAAAAAAPAGADRAPAGGAGAMAAGGAAQGQRASLRAQAGALYRKNAAFQARHMCSNVCLLSAPIFFCLMLLAVQVAINRLLLTGADYECGCQCTRCCFNGDAGNCSAVQAGTCPFSCLETNRSACGIQFSTPQQSVFCAIPHTSSWPAILQTPAEGDRAEPAAPKAALLFTGDDPRAAAALAAGLVSPPDLTPGRLVSARSYLEAFNADLGTSPATVPGEVLSLLGLRLGTSSRIQAGLYLETALVGDAATLYALWPDGTCGALGLEGRYNTSLADMLGAMVNASNAPAAAATINRQLATLTASLAGGGGGGASPGGVVSGLRMNCTDVVLTPAPDAAALQRTLYCGYYQARCNGTPGTNQYAAAFDWGASNASVFAPDLYYNDTWGLPRNEAPTVYQRVPAVLSMAVNAWLKRVLGEGFSAELVGVMETPKAASKIKLDFSALLGPLFFTWVIQMLLPVFLMQLVYEKERRLRMMMKMHGLGDAAYWAVSYTWFLALYAAYMAVFVAFGSIIRLNMFTQNGYGLQFVFYFIFGNNMIALSFLLSCFFSSAKTATVFAYLVVFGTGLIGSLLLSQLINAGQWYTTLLELVPSFALFRGLFELGEYAFLAVYRSSAGMTAANLADPGNGMLTTWLILGLEWVAFMALAWYLEQVYASGTGNRRHPLYPLTALRDALAPGRAGRAPRPSDELQLPTIRSGAGGRRRRRRGAAARAAAAAGGGAEAWDEPDDVAAERARVEGMACYDGSHPIVVRGLNKTYAALDGQPPKLAVRSLNLAIEKGECFGLLGPNGAGKSTSINMLVGLLPPSAGTALVGGHDITAAMDAVYALMGVCPQHDLLWDCLTGAEHLRFYGRLKGLTGAELESAVEAGLRRVNLWNNRLGDKAASAYSGGMRRRLSVAISFTGDPLVVYLDEPSTGLDPASRRNLWEVVKANKRDRAIVLTTHSMEEAEMLCDRLGIFVDGRLVCIGNPKEITSRQGGFLVFTIAVPSDQEAAAHAFVAGLSPSARLTYSVGGTLKYELPTSEVSLSRVFAAMAGSKAAGLTVLDWGVANATLEEVFIRFARRIGAKAGD